MTKPLVVISINTSWNIVNFRLGLIRALKASDYTVVALTPSDHFAERFAEEGIIHVPIAIDGRGTSPISDSVLLMQYWSVLRRLRPIAFLGYTIKPNIWGSIAAQRLGIPVINNVAGLGDAFAGSGPINQIVRRLYWIALRGSSTVFFQNPDDRALFIDAGIVSKAIARLLPGSGIDIARFTPPAERDEPTDQFRFVLMARLLWAKGIAEYVAAARIVRAAHPAVRFELLGLAQEGRGAIDQATLERWVDEGVVELLQPADDVRPILAAADCVVLPTFYPEGTPRTLLEAAAMGRPIITTDVPGCREIVRDGENGFLVEPRSVDMLARRMLDMITMPVEQRHSMGRSGRAIAEERFDETIVIDRYLEAIAKIRTR